MAYAKDTLAMLLVFFCTVAIYSFWFCDSSKTVLITSQNLIVEQRGGGGLAQAP